MSLIKYKQKRSAGKTPEPFGGKPTADQLRFVIQKHAASHLHYDFRLEMDGVLKSWAIPKGPSTDPCVKRLAIMVEDHPYDYRSFEGIIPEGEYGGGTVMVWDEGFYEPVEDNKANKKAREIQLMHGLQKGKISFILKGKKLKGAFTLVKTHGQGENEWLLMKTEDRYASKEEITLKDKSVLSRRTLEQIKAAQGTAVYGQKNRGAKKSIISSIEKKAPQTNDIHKEKMKAGISRLMQKGTDRKKPGAWRPMLATLVDEPYDDKGWSYEIKWDGYRALAFLQNGSVELKSRNDKSFNKKFYAVCEALQNWPVNAVVDGEVVVLNDRGISDFNALQNWRSEADGQLFFYVFDILWLEGKDLTALPFNERREILRSVIPQNNDAVRLSETFDASGTRFYEAAAGMGLEGIMAKKQNSPYLPGERSAQWLKIKVNKRQEVVIGGFTKNEGSPKLFSSLLVGVYKEGKLQYTGKIGTGFDLKTQRRIMARFKKLITKKAPFATLPDLEKPTRFRSRPPKTRVTWLKPQQVCEVSFTEMTPDGVMRHPSFEGLRMDKEAAEVVEEKATPIKKMTKPLKITGEIIQPVKNKERRTLLNPTEESQIRRINGHDLSFTHLSKLYWPKEGISKRDLLNYYYAAAPYILPYLKDRPQSLNRFPGGINNQGFYQKDIKGKGPDWLERFPYHTDDDQNEKEYLVAASEASLLYMASLGCIELHPWHSRVSSPDHPDWCVIDLDPDKQSFEKVIRAAQTVHELLDMLEIPSYPKTSGSTGLHIYIPLGAKYTYEQSKELARVIVTIVQSTLPGFTTIERSIRDRKGKMYLDFLQNRPQATIAAPYSLRPRPGATVSMPLQWDEVKPGLKIGDFTIHNALERMKNEGDIFKPILGKGIDLKAVMQKLEVVEV